MYNNTGFGIPLATAHKLIRIIFAMLSNRADFQLKDIFGQVHIMKLRWVFSILSALLLLSVIACQGARITCKSSADLSGSNGGSITIAWDSNTEPNLGGYRVFYGASPGKYKNCVDVGKATEASPGVTKYILTNLGKGKRYYIAVIAYSTYDILGGFSNEVSAVAE